MALPTAVSPDSLVNVIRALEEKYRGNGDSLRLEVMGDIFYAVAEEGRISGSMSPYAVQEWLKGARAAYETALEAYRAQTTVQIPGFEEDLEDRISDVDRRLGYVTPRGSQQAYRDEARELWPGQQPQPQTMPAGETRVAVMNR